MEKRWIYKTLPDVELTNFLAKEINVSKPIATILAQRGLVDFDSAKEFFRPSLCQLHNPFDMCDMEVAVDLLDRSIKENKKILIYGDYDVDGTTSVALVYQYLKRLTDNITYYIPDRYSEGYGVSDKGITYAISSEVELLITLDCGIKAINTINKATEAGIDVIICDHHLPGDQLPNAAAVLDPKRSDCNYPYAELSGCGIGFKLLQAYYKKFQSEVNPFDYLEYVAISIAADIVPMTNENRILAFHGLKKLNDNPAPGINALIEISASKKPLNVHDVVFGLAPRINAAGRITHANAAVELLIATSTEEALKSAESLNLNNDDRRKVDSLITDEAIGMIEKNADLQLAKSTVLFKNDWHKGVIGIVASRCIEKFYRPTIILTESNNKATGSARSVPGFDVYKAIEACSDLLEQYGGHTHAAGLTLSLANVKLFQQRFEEQVAKNISDDDLIPPVEIDVELNFKNITSKFFNVLNQMHPFGPGNMSPVFVSKNLQGSNFKTINDKHVKFAVLQKGCPKKFEAIAFNMAECRQLIDDGTAFDMAYSLEMNEYKGFKSIQLVCKDIKLKN